MTLRFGVPLTVSGVATCAGAIWLGPDGQGWFVLACGLIVVAVGAAMLLMAIATTLFFLEAALRVQLRRLRAPRASGMHVPSSERTPSTPGIEPSTGYPSEGPHIF